MDRKGQITEVHNDKVVVREGGRTREIDKDKLQGGQARKGGTVVLEGDSARVQQNLDE